MSQVLYRKYRPQTFEQVYGQEHVVETLKGALSSGRVGHAYLFTGPRGTGKTTLARIFAKALNCTDFIKTKEANFDTKSSVHQLGLHSYFGKEGNLSKGRFDIPCNKCVSCLVTNESRSLDLIEIDAASNRGIEEIRNLKESALVAAPGGGYKVFIIDEVHMLTKDAFNALLKLLEEPPSHVMFILATTEPHKILPTVLSRVQRFDFRRLTPKQIFEKLKEISIKEKIDTEDEGLKAIALSSDGALRDAEVALSKIIVVSHGKKIKLADVNEILGLIPSHFHPEFLGYFVTNDKNNALGFVQKIYESGFDLEYFSKDFLEYLRRLIISKINPAILTSLGEDPIIYNNIDNQKLIKMINVFTKARNEIKSSPIPQLPLELAILEILE